MCSQELNVAFAKLRPSEELTEKVLSAPMENKENPRRLVRRVAACAAVLAMLIAVALFNHAPPYFSVRVYASETDVVKIDRMGDTIFIPARDESYDYKNDSSYRPIFDSNLTGEGNRLWDETCLWLEIRLDDETKNYDQISVFVNGQELQQSIQSGVLGYIFNGGEVGRFIVLPVENTMRISIVLYEDGKVLQEYGMEVEPVEGGWNLTLDETYITSLGTAVFRKFS